ncbi:alpha/beta hydrolase [Aeromicrobium alkaliterrae]|uniref:AB hydrolase-1 domain-containing protein n=1 Tax=Aeromicrobium alkaliterrae TaxID=302168 RepID=A0ABN2JRY5_9ACTN
MTWSDVRFVVGDGVSLAVEEVGDVGAPPLVLVCGGSTSKEWWDDDLCELLATAGRRVVRYDLRDSGQSSTSPPGEPDYTGTDLADDLAAVIRSLDAGPAHVWGLSLGGGVVQAFATRHPDLVAAVVLESTSPGGPNTPGAPELPGPSPAVLATFEETDPGPDWDDLDASVAHLVEAERPFAGTLGLDVGRMSRIVRRMLERGGPQRSAPNQFIVEDGPHVIDLAALTAPTLVIHGDADPLFPLAHGERLVEVLPHAELLVVPGLGHEYPPPATWDVIVPAVLAHTSATGGS